eukprot:SAG22_NODE_62_length_23371_cov_84.500602_15_plen_48_part_00
MYPSYPPTLSALVPRGMIDGMHSGKMSTFVDLVHVCTEFRALDVKLL